MDDFISRDAAIQFFNDWVDDLNKQINDSMNYPHLRSDYKVCKTQLLDCIYAIEEMPAADVRSVVPGKWLERKLPTVDPRDYFCRMALCCSRCGHEIDYGRGYGPNYCGNCGAMMQTKSNMAEEGE